MFEHARETISELIEKVKRHNKLINIADTSEGGWETVRQYESNQVVSNLDDESKINKAENRALRKHNFKGKKILAKSNPPQFAASSFTGKKPTLDMIYRFSSLSKPTRHERISAQRSTRRRMF